MAEHRQEDVAVVVPVYNEEKTVAGVIESLLDRGYRVIAVDDGSRDSTPEILAGIASERDGLSVYTHVINRGLGTALRTGLRAAVDEGASCIVTCDADGQHDPDDIEGVIEPLLKGEADVVIGSRDFSEMPLSRSLGNTLMNLLTLLFYGCRVSDSQSGLRAFTARAASVIDIKSRGYGVSSEIIGEIHRNGLRMREVTIKTIYTPETISKGTSTSVGIRILLRLILNMLRRV